MNEIGFIELKKRLDMIMNNVKHIKRVKQRKNDERDDMIESTEVAFKQLQIFELLNCLHIDNIRTFNKQINEDNNVKQKICEAVSLVRHGHHVTLLFNVDETMYWRHWKINDVSNNKFCLLGMIKYLSMINTMAYIRSCKYRMVNRIKNRCKMNKNVKNDTAEMNNNKNSTNDKNKKKVNLLLIVTAINNRDWNQTNMATIVT